MPRIWTEEQRRQQAENIRRWKPWKQSTGPRTKRGKNKTRLNAVRHGFRSQASRELCAALRAQARFVRAVQDSLRKKRNSRACKNPLSCATMTKTGLIADIGATNARFALADARGVHSEHVLKCADYPGLREAALAYLDIVRPPIRPSSAAMAIAGPVLGDRFEMTNHVWSFSQKETQAALGLTHFHLVNDFVALALAVPHLKDADVKQIGGGKPQAGAPIGIIGPGTGLGVASLIWDGTRYVPVPGEGGHVTMPARTQREFDAFRELLRDKYHHVSAERVCSGKGLVNLYNALRAIDGRGDLPDRAPEDISAAALTKTCALCGEALAMMLAFLGRIAGNLALTLGSYGGIYIAGGIVGKLGYDYFNASAFYEEFTAKGRFDSYMKAIPAFVIEHPFPAFVGLQADLMRGEV